jgi:hypothetical protein
MSASNFLSRLEALEARFPKRGARHLVVISRPGETPEQAEARARRDAGVPPNPTGSDIMIRIC